MRAEQNGEDINNFSNGILINHEGLDYAANLFLNMGTLHRWAPTLRR